MYDEDAVRSGLSLKRGTDGEPETPAGEAPKIEGTALSRRMEELRKRRDAGTLSAEDVAYLKEAAKDKTLPVGARYLSNCFLSGWRRGEGDLLRALYYMETALILARSSAQRASCHQELFALKRDMGKGELTPECMEDYDRFVEAAVEGIHGQDAETILLVLEGDAAEKMEDYALLAAAARAWSVHPENGDDFDREEAEARFYRYAKAFEKQGAEGHGQPVYRQTRKGGKTGKDMIHMRKKLLDHTDKPVRKARAPVPEPVSIGIVAAQDPADASANDRDLIEQLEELTRETEGESVDSIDVETLDKYLDGAMDVVKELLYGGNTVIMRYVVEHAELFERMEDYVILGASALLWFCHPDNRDVGEKLRMRTLGEQWSAEALRLSEPEENYPLYRRMGREGSALKGNRLLVEHYWRQLLKNVFEKVSSCS